jgi:hypothetical protein
LSCFGQLLLTVITNVAAVTAACKFIFSYSWPSNVMVFVQPKSGSWTGWSVQFWGAGQDATTRMRPRRAEQCLPEEDATPKWDAGAHVSYAWSASPLLPDPRFAGPSGNALGRHSIARSCNAAMCRKKCAIHSVANSPQRRKPGIARDLYR